MKLDNELLRMVKAGFVPMPGGAPPMDPAMGGMPMDPAMAGGAPPMGGMPPMDPAMAGGAPPMGGMPMDPAMAGGMPPMDPAMAGGMPPMDPAMLESALGGGGGSMITMTPEELTNLIQVVLGAKSGTGVSPDGAPASEPRKKGGGVEAKLDMLMEALGIGAQPAPGM